MHSIVRGTGTPQDRDEVNKKRELKTKFFCPFFFAREMYHLYQDASTVLELMEKRKGTANRLSLNSSIRNKKACLAIAAETSRLSLLSASSRACVCMRRLF